MDDIKKLRDKLEKFAKERDWEQYHSPKNLACALSVEASELLEIFQWLTDKQSKDLKNDLKSKPQVKEELADIFLYLIRLADKLDIDLIKAAEEKLEINAKKYPIELSKGNSIKYNERSDA